MFVAGGRRETGTGSSSAGRGFGIGGNDAASNKLNEASNRITMQLVVIRIEALGTTGRFWAHRFGIGN